MASGVSAIAWAAVALLAVATVAVVAVTDASAACIGAGSGAGETVCAYFVTAAFAVPVVSDAGAEAC